MGVKRYVKRIYHIFFTKHINILGRVKINGLMRLERWKSHFQMPEFLGTA